MDWNIWAHLSSWTFLNSSLQIHIATHTLFLMSKLLSNNTFNNTFAVISQELQIIITAIILAWIRKNPFDWCERAHFGSLDIQYIILYDLYLPLKALRTTNSRSSPILFTKACKCCATYLISPPYRPYQAPYQNLEILHPDWWHSIKNDRNVTMKYFHAWSLILLIRLHPLSHNKTLQVAI